MTINPSDRIKNSLNFICPECKSKLVLCDAKEMHQCYKDQDRARKCTKCSFLSYMGDTEDHTVTYDEFCKFCIINNQATMLSTRIKNVV